MASSDQQVQILCYKSILGLRISPDEIWEHRLFQDMEELQSLSGKLVFDLDRFGKYYPKFEWVKNSGKKGMILGILRITVHISLASPNLEKVLEEDQKLSDEEKGVYLYQIRSLIEKRISDLFIASHLANPGCLDLQSADIKLNNEFFGSIGRMAADHIRLARAYAEKIHWPKLERLSLVDVWQWLSLHKGFTDGFSDSAISRALNAFSHLFDLTDEPFQLFWAIVGIEALYVQGKEGLLEQVREKTQVLLGEQTTFKKKISQMYNFRSGFVHGSLDFPGVCLPPDIRPEVEKHDDLSMEATYLAVAILLSTLQELIVRNWKGLKFSYVVSDIK